MTLKRLFNYILPVFVAELLYFFYKDRVGASLIAGILLFIILESKLPFKQFATATLAGVALMFLGSWASMEAALNLWYIPLMEASYTFKGGLVGGFIEMGVYLLVTLIPLKWLITKSLKRAIQETYLLIIILTFIGAIIQATYLAGWQHPYYV